MNKENGREHLSILKSMSKVGGECEVIFQEGDAD